MHLLIALCACQDDDAHRAVVGSDGPPGWFFRSSIQRRRMHGKSGRHRAQLRGHNFTCQGGERLEKAAMGCNGGDGGAKDVEMEKIKKK